MIKIVSLCKAYNKKQVLDNVSFYIPKSKITTLVGPNGAGKTTTLEIITGLRNAQSGYVEIDGNRDIFSNQIKKNIGVMLQETNLYKKISAKEAIKFFGKFYNESMSVEEVLEIVKLEPNKRFGEMSGGQKQKLLLALAIVHNPKLLILDEPTSAMDPVVRFEFWEMLKKLRDNGKTILLATHNLNEAERISDNIVILNQGKVVAQGDIKEIRGSLNIKRVINVDLGDKNVQFMDILSKSGINYKFNNIENFISIYNSEFNKIYNILNNAKLYEYIENLHVSRLPLEELFFEYVKNS